MIKASAQHELLRPCWQPLYTSQTPLFGIEAIPSIRNNGVQ